MTKSRAGGDGISFSLVSGDIWQLADDDDVAAWEKELSDSKSITKDEVMYVSDSAGNFLNVDVESRNGLT